eukprot:6205184-Pleurochrysis_carterae.AAC.8
MLVVGGAGILDVATRRCAPSLGYSERTQLRRAWRSSQATIALHDDVAPRPEARPVHPNMA